MISFHLVYIGDSYPYAKQVIYTFHMPVFLAISGYLMNIHKPPRQFLLTIYWLVVPYVVMESGYTIACSMLPIREHIDNLTIEVFLDKLFLHPLGPYWFLHTLIMCGLTYYGVFLFCKKGLLSCYILIGFAYTLYARVGLLSLPLSFYFLVGVIIRNSHLTFLQVFQPSLLSFIAAGFLFANPANLHSGTIGGLFIVYFVISGSLSVYPYFSKWILHFILYLGKNTLPLFLFSPIFTILCKSLVPVLSFEPTGMLFLFCALFICISGSLCICKVMEFCKISSYFWGPKR